MLRDAAAPFAFNNDAQVKLVRIGRGGIAVTLVDDVLQNPEGVAALGFSQSYAADRGNFYPGVRAPLPELGPVISGARAQAVLGFAPRHRWRDDLSPADVAVVA